MLRKYLPVALATLVLAGATAVPGSAAGPSKGKSPADLTVEEQLKAQGLTLQKGEAKLDFGPKPLKGAVEMSRQLDPLRADLRSGEVFADESLKKMGLTAQRDAEWFWIPKWRAGLWRTTDATNTYNYNYRTHQEDTSPRQARVNGVSFVGLQTDKKGEVWDAALSPEYNMLSGDGFKQYSITQEYRPVFVCSDRITMFSSGTLIRADNATNKITSSSQFELVQTVVPSAPGTLTEYSLMKTFDEHGRPLSLQRTTATLKLEDNYYPIDRFRDKDMHMAFCKFLDRNDMKDLIPAYAQSENASNRFRTAAESSSRNYPYPLDFAEWGDQSLTK